MLKATKKSCYITTNCRVVDVVHAIDGEMQILPVGCWTTNENKIKIVFTNFSS
jgi:hypothetical protein